MLPWKLKFPYFRQPPGGWHLPKDGTIHRGDTPEKLEEAVRAHLLQNGKAPGNIADEITMFTHLNWPHLTEVNLEYVETDRAPPRTKSDVQREVFDWMFKLALRAQESPPDKHVSDARIEKCRACRFNKAYLAEDDLYEPIRRKAFLMTKGRLPDKLGFCTKWSIDCRVACQWQEALLGKPAEVLDSCWRS
jgi:hypothetical protein